MPIINTTIPKTYVGDGTSIDVTGNTISIDSTYTDALIYQDETSISTHDTDVEVQVGEIVIAADTISQGFVVSAFAKLHSASGNFVKFRCYVGINAAFGSNTLIASITHDDSDSDSEDVWATIMEKITAASFTGDFTSPVYVQFTAEVEADSAGYFLGGNSFIIGH